ncbi:MAG: GNAT family N-acetyltransferase [Dehalococcoidia bacterium]
MIQGKQVALRPATERDKRMVYEWLAESDITPSIMGPPHFSDHPVPAWEEFCADYKPYFFDGSSPELGRCFIIMINSMPVGQLNYNDIDQHHQRTELDIWMSCEANCDKGYGPDALQTLCEYLFRTYGIVEFVIRPSARNHRAIRAYEKAGFQRVELTPEQAEAEYPSRDYADSVFLIRHMSKT